MRRLSNIALLLCVGGLMIAAWMIVPGKMLDRQMQQAFCTGVAVPVENVQPYGEEYAELRRKLRRAILARTEGEYTRTPADPAEEMTVQTTERFRKFVKLWSDAAGMRILGEEEDAEENLFLCVRDKECELAVFYRKDPDIYAPNPVYLEPASGIPVSGTVCIDMSDSIVTVDDLWKGLLEAYGQELGIPIYENSYEDLPIRQNAVEIYDVSKMYDAGEIPARKIIDVNRGLYAESMDGSCMLEAAVSRFDNDRLIFDFALQLAEN